MATKASDLSHDNILRDVHDTANQALRVSAFAVPPPGATEVIISDTDDSIKIGNGSGTFMDVNSDGSINVIATTLPLPTGAASETTLSSVSSNISSMEGKLAAALVTDPYDNIALTYVASGNGVGEIQTVVYKLSTTTVATLTLSYDSSDRLTNIVRS